MITESFTVIADHNDPPPPRIGGGLERGNQAPQMAISSTIMTNRLNRWDLFIGNAAERKQARELAPGPAPAKRVIHLRERRSALGSVGLGGRLDNLARTEDRATARQARSCAQIDRWPTRSTQRICWQYGPGELAVPEQLAIWEGAGPFPG